MLIRMVSTAAGTNFLKPYHAGKEYDVPDAQAKEWLEKGFAVPAGTKDKDLLAAPNMPDHPDANRPAAAAGAEGGRRFAR